MKLLFLVFVFTQSICFAPVVSGSDAWKNFFWVGADGTYSVNNRYAKSMGYDFVGYRSFGTTAQYYNDINTQDMSMYESAPWSRAIRALTGLTNDTITYTLWSGYSTAQKNWLLDNIGWGTSTAAPYCFTGNEGNATSNKPIPDWQQQRVIDLLVTQMMIEFEKMVYAPKNTKFAGVIIDECDLKGSFWKWDAAQGKQVSYALTDADRVGASTTLIHAISTGGNITHEYATYSDGQAAFLKQLNTTMKATYPEAKLILEPYTIYNSTPNVDEWIYTISQRADKLELVPDMLFQENDELAFTNNELNFSGSLGITRNKVGSTQCTNGEESFSRQVAIACGTSTSYYNWSLVLSNGGTMPSYAEIDRKSVV